MRPSALRFLTAACLLLAGPALANFDTRPVDRLSIGDGLSNDSVNAMAVDAQGFLWIATEDGLNRFDGQQFEPYRRDEIDPASIADNFVTALLAEGDSLYVATRTGSVQRLDLQRERFESLPPAIATTLEGNPVDDLVLVGPRHVLAGSRASGLAAFRFDPAGAVQTGQWLGPESGLPSDRVHAVFRTEDGGVWVGTAAGLCLLRDLGPRCSAPDWPVLAEIGNADIRALHVDRRGHLWVGTNLHGLYRIGTDGTLVGHYTRESGGLPSNRIESLLLDSRNRMWAGSAQGVAQFDEGCGCFRAPRAMRRPTDPTQQLAVSLAEDPSGGLWVGYFNFGLERIALDANGIRHYLPSSVAGPAPSVDQVRSILPVGNERYLLGTFGDGIWEMETEPDRGLARSFRRAVPIEGLTDEWKQVWAMERVDRHLYIGTDGGLLRWDADTARLERGLIPDGTTAIRQLLHDPRRQVVWIGSDHGLCRFHPASGETRCVGTDAGTPGHLRNRSVFALHLDRAGRLWTGTWSGLYQVDPDTLVATIVPREQTDMDDALIFDIAESAEGQLWIGSIDGLIRFTPGQPGEVLRERQGLSNRAIRGIEIDRDGNLWLASIRDVMRFDPLSRTVTTYDHRDGLQGESFYYGAHARDDQGRMLFGGSSGLNRIEPSRMTRTLHSPDVHLSRLSVLGQVLSANVSRANLPRLEAAPGFTRQIRLGPRQNMLEVRFAAPEFDQPGMLRFEYQLAGLDDTWISLGQHRLVSLTNLPPGDYRLTIRARNRFGEASPSPAVLDIQVTPPTWATWWFRTFGAILLVAVAWGFYGWRTQDLRRQRLRLEREVARSTEEVRSQNRRLAEQQAELERANRELFQLSNRDALTGAYNRRYIQEHLSRAVAGSERVAVAILDIDHFKRINDRYGHLAGDDCLRHVVACMSEVIGERATFARWGGEEFIVLLTAMDDDSIADLLERLRVRIEARPAFTGETEIPLTASIGWFQDEPGARAPMAELIRRADEALYQAKADGRNRVLRAVAPG